MQPYYLVVQQQPSAAAFAGEPLPQQPVVAIVDALGAVVVDVENGTVVYAAVHSTPTFAATPGNDPAALTDLRQAPVQRLTLRTDGSADNGTFTLAFRGERTEPVGVNASAVELAAALNALGTVPFVRASRADDEPAFLTLPNSTVVPVMARVWGITFLGDAGARASRRGCASAAP